MKRRWTDSDLYAHFGLTEDEAAYIEAIIHPRADPVAGVPHPVLAPARRVQIPASARAETETPEADEDQG